MYIQLFFLFVIRLRSSYGMYEDIGSTFGYSLISSLAPSGDCRLNLARIELTCAQEKLVIS